MLLLLVYKIFSSLEHKGSKKPCRGELEKSSTYIHIVWLLKWREYFSLTQIAICVLLELLSYILVLGWIQFMGLGIRIFGGFGWVCSSVLVDEPGFGMVRSSIFRIWNPSKKHELWTCSATNGLDLSPSLEKPNFKPFQTQVRLPKPNYGPTWTL